MRRPERFKAEHGSDPSFDKPVILLDNIVKVFTLANLDAFVFVNIVLLDTGCIGSAFVDIDQTGFAVGADSFVQKS